MSTELRISFPFNFAILPLPVYVHVRLLYFGQVDQGYDTGERRISMGMWMRRIRLSRVRGVGGGVGSWVGQGICSDGFVREEQQVAMAGEQVYELNMSL